MGGPADDLYCLPAKKYRSVETCFNYGSSGNTQFMPAIQNPVMPVSLQAGQSLPDY
jgi:hypothetical protein